MNTKDTKILHFADDFTHSEIIDYLKERKDIFYFTRTLKEGSEFHLIKVNNNGYFKINEFQNQLLHQYSKYVELSPLLKDIKVKGNSNFIIIENISFELLNRIKFDLTSLLIK
jgi:hypothetical protein